MTGPSGDGLDSARPGERWVIRYRLPDGSATDLTGWLDALTPDAVRLSTVDQQSHVVERAAVIVARRAPPARGGPDPRRVSAADLERRALPGWLAEHEPLGEWTLRSAGGFTGRANSCLAVGDPGVPWARAADRVVAYADEHGIEPRALVIGGSREEAELRALGWVDCYVPTEVLAVRLADFLAGSAAARRRPGGGGAGADLVGGLPAEPAQLRRPGDPEDDLGREPAAGLRQRGR